MRQDIVRNKQVLSIEECKAILDRNIHGVIGLNGRWRLYLYRSCELRSAWWQDIFHGRPKGYKSESFKRTSKTSFCVVDQSFVVPSLRANDFRSVIVWGHLKKIETEEEKVKAYEPWLKNFVRDSWQWRRDSVFEAICRSVRGSCECMTGKQALEEVRLAGQKLAEKNSNISISRL